MDYENRPVPEGINVSRTHPLADFAWLLALVGIVVTVVVLALSLAAGWLAQQVPFEQEVRWAQVMPASSLATEQQDERTQAWLQALADDLVAAHPLPDGMRVQVHYVEDDTVVNAYATLGGNVVVFSGLLRALESENAVAMVLAHEIAHIRYRDPIVALGRGVAVALGLSALGGMADSGLAQNMVGNVGLLTVLSFSRRQETRADEDALLALQAHYGHLAGADSLFAWLQEHTGPTIPEFFATHPLTDDRLNRIRETARGTTAGEQSPLPAWLLVPSS